MVTDDPIAAVRDFLVRQTGVRAAAVTPEARLVEDLGVDGDDLVEAMEAFFPRFGVDPGGYAHGDYASAEGFPLFGKGKGARLTMTVSMLAQAVERGRWRE